MIVIFNSGDVAKNVFSGVKKSKRYKLMAITNFDWGHVMVINGKPVTQWKYKQDWFFDDLPDVHLANLGSENSLEMSLERIDNVS